MGLLELEEVTLVLEGKPILRDLTLDIWEGHVHAVVGPNGAGKSTLAAVIMGLAGYRDHAGEVRYRGESIGSLDVAERAARGITMAWQEPARFAGITVEEFITAAAGKEVGEEELRFAMEEVGLEPEDYRGRAVDRTLSGGERKKVELASILAMKPDLALLDEPDSGIDIESIHRIFDAVKVLKERGTTVLLITHSLAVLDQAEHAFLLCNGELWDKGRVEKVRRWFRDRCIPCDHKNEPVARREAEPS